MSTERQTASTSKHWAPYAPGPDAPWNLRRVVYLHRRAGFAATWSELQRDLADGPKASIDRLLSGKARMEGVPSDFAAVSDTLAQRADNPTRLKAWWVYRMLFGPDPLTERLVLMWHNHFATSAAKVGMAVQRQNQIFRESARAPFGELLKRIVHDPALLVWLDATASHKGKPNENLGRELMELFTLGLGHFTEKDVKAAARTLTGWTVEKGVFKDDMNLHDPGEKTLLGKTGRWKGDDMVRMLLEHPATAERLAFRICELFLGEVAVDPTRVKSLATGLRERNLDVGWAVETVLRSETFFAEANLGNRILSPPEYVVGAVRALELFNPAPSTLILAEFIANLGQNLFYPANVFGWPGGRSWISSRSAVGRYNYAVALVGGADVGRAPAFDPWALARRHGQGKDLASVVAFHAELILGRVPDASWRDRILDTLGPEAIANAATARQAVALVLASPEAQLA
jgi:hypothetical protein